MLTRILLTSSLALVGGGALVALAPAAMADGRDPAYAAARAHGDVGEKMDGYLGLIGPGDPALRRMVDDLNIRRKAVYAEHAQAQHATVEEYAFTSGCHLIDATVPGEKYQGPDGAWHVRTSAAPLRDARCP
jgi:uncharacterized protein YdbL (DUF1318 family)